jgi:hypothetical protein
MADKDQRDAREADVARRDRRRAEPEEGSVDPRHEPVDGFLRSEGIRFLEAGPEDESRRHPSSSWEGDRWRCTWIVFHALWKRVQPLLPKVERRFRYPGRKRLPDRQALQGIRSCCTPGSPGGICRSSSVSAPARPARGHLRSSPNGDQKKSRCQFPGNSARGTKPTRGLEPRTPSLRGILAGLARTHG